MQVTDFNILKIAKSSDTYKTWPLSFLLNVFGLNCVTEKSKLSKIRAVITSALFATLAFFSFYFKLSSIYNVLNVSVKITETIQAIHDYCQYTIDLFFVQKYGGVVYSDYYKQYITIDDLIGKRNYSATVNSRMAKLVGLFVTLWLISSVCDYLAWYESYGWKIPLMYALAYIHILIKMLTTLDIVSEVLNVQCRMEMMSEIVQYFYENANCLPGMVCSKDNKYWIDPADAVQERQPPASADYNKVKFLSSCYLLLAKQCTYINQMFGIRILLNSLSLLIDMVRLINLATRMIIGIQNIPNNGGYFAIASTLSRLLICVLILASLVVQCETVYRQNDRIISIIDNLLINKETGPELRASMSELRGLAQARPLNFHLANFFRVDYSMLVSTASVVATYSIILLQTIH